VGALLATGRLHGGRKPHAPAEESPPGKEEKDTWARLLAEPRLGLAMLIGAVCGIPGASYLAGLHILITSKASTANQVTGVVLFVLIEFLLVIVPFASLEIWPEATKAVLHGSQDWLLRHARQLMAYTAGQGIVLQMALTDHRPGLADVLFGQIPRAPAHRRGRRSRAVSVTDGRRCGSTGARAS
jgi:hypothetical protein